MADGRPQQDAVLSPRICAGTTNQTPDKGTVFMRISRGTRTAAAALAAALVLAACSGATDEPAAPVEPTPAPVETPAEAEEEAADELGTIVDIALETPGFDTLVAAVIAAGLVETLQGEGPFTVFAPTDAAFAALPEGLLEKLLDPANLDVLVKILTYHVVSGSVLSSEITAGDVATVEGQDITLATEGGVTVNGAKVIVADVLASNGVIHVIDQVILPPDVDVDAL
jgi:uncharacterized surface protein with fasciclin (FAS1) repeats